MPRILSFLIIISSLLTFRISFAQTNLYNIYEIGKGEILKKDYQYIEYLYDDLLSATPMKEGVEDYNWENLTGVIDFQESVIVPFQYRYISKIRNYNSQDRLNKHKLVKVSTGSLPALFRLTKNTFDQITPFNSFEYHFIPTNDSIIFTSRASENYIINLKTKTSVATKLTIETYPLNDQLLTFKDHGGKQFMNTGLMNVKGETILPAKFYRIADYNESLLVMEKGDTVGILNNKGEILLPLIFYYVYPFEKGQSRFFIKTFNDGKKLNISEKLKEEMSDWTATFNKYPHKKYSLNNAQIQQIGLTGAFDFQGNLIIPFEYDYLKKGIDTEIIASKNNKLGILSENGDVIMDFIYDDIKLAFNNFYVISANKKEGLFSKQGQEIFDIEYEKIFPVSSTKVLFLKDNNWYAYDINKPKTFVETNLDPNIELSYLYTHPVKSIPDTYFEFKKDGKYGIIDKDFKITVSAVNESNPSLIFNKYFAFGYMKNNSLYTIKGKLMQGMNAVDYNIESEEFLNTMVDLPVFQTN